MRFEFWMLLVATTLALGCTDGGNGSPPCVDNDLDGYGDFCALGLDCDDADIDNWASCDSCVDTDGDSHFVGCDAFTTRLGPDCDPADGSTFIGAAAIEGPSACMTDGDGDGYGSTVAPMDGIAGTDCDDVDPNSFVTCDGSCQDADGDSFYVGCDAYASVEGPDCDDTDPYVSPGEPELADDAIDNDCDGSDLVAAMGPGVYVDNGNVSCTDSGEGSQSTPYCSLAPAIYDASVSTSNVFVTGGDYAVSNVRTSGSIPLRIYGGYDALWNRDLDSEVTNIDTEGAPSTVGLSCSQPVCIIDGVHVSRVNPAAINYGDVVFYVEEFGAFTRSTLTVETGDQFHFSIGTPEDNASISRAVVRDVDVRSTGRTPVVIGQLDYITLENSRISTEYASTSSVSLSVLNGNRVALRNNALHASGNGQVYLVELNGTDAISDVVNNSFSAPAGSFSAALRVRNHAELRLVNNAMEAGTPVSILTFAAAPTPQLTLRNNMMGDAAGVSTLSQFLFTTEGEYFDAAEINGCTACFDTGGNVDGDPEFPDPRGGDFSLSAGSPGIDGGVDPAAFVDWQSFAVDIDGFPRPVDGDGSLTAEWDIGAQEN